jgi:hypothetical protein
MKGSNVLRMEELQRMTMSGLADLQTSRSEPLNAQMKNILGNRRLTVREVAEEVEISIGFIPHYFNGLFRNTSGLSKICAETLH